MRFGIPDMVSDTYYQLQGTTGSEVIGDKRKRNYGWVFSVVMVLVAFLMMVAILDLDKGLQCLAFIGCGGLAFVGFAPHYLDSNEHAIHKAAAIMAAAGCVGWCLSVCWWVTFVIALIYTVYLLVIDFFISKDVKFHPWYWLEIAGFADVFLTYLF